MIFKIGDVVEFEKLDYRNKESFKVVRKVFLSNSWFGI